MEREEIVILAEKLHDVLGAMNLADELNRALVRLKDSGNREIDFNIRINIGGNRVFSTKIASDVCSDRSMQAMTGTTLNTELLRAVEDVLEEYHTRLSDGIAAFKVPTC